VQPGAVKEAQSGQRGRRQGPVETLVQEVVRRAATIGLGGFFLTEEAIRRAFAEVVPQEWVQFFVRQNEEMRRELLDRMVREFGDWLRGVDPTSLARSMLEGFDFSLRIELSAHPRSSGRKKKTAGSVSLVRKRK
jgi:hypothetical protein